MVIITRKKGESKDSMFRKFSRSFIEEDVITEVRKRLFYKKPSLQKKDEEKERLQRKSRARKMISRFPRKINRKI
jgi:ribosomal protein S21